MPNTDKQQTLDWILIAKGIGIILVVIGHFWPANSPAYWTEMRRIIYTTHMPLFFLLSGWLYQHGKYPYRTLLANKAQRLLYPFASIAILFFGIKFAAGQVFQLENPVNLASLYTILFNPIQSYMPLLWFVHALFLIFALYPLLRHQLSDSSLLLLFIAINLLVDSETPLIGKPLLHIPFFIGGILLRQHRHTLEHWLDGSAAAMPWLAAVFVVSCYLLKTTLPLWPQASYPLLFTAGISGSMLVIKASKALADSTAQGAGSALETVGFYSMTIYLFHTLFESAARIVLTQGLRHYWTLPFELVALSAIVAGVVFPLCMEKFLLRRHQLTRRFILGLPD